MFKKCILPATYKCGVILTTDAYFPLTVSTISFLHWRQEFVMMRIFKII